MLREGKIPQENFQDFSVALKCQSRKRKNEEKKQAKLAPHFCCQRKKAFFPGEVKDKKKKKRISISMSNGKHF